jgi:hypothetical protein
VQVNGKPADLKTRVAAGDSIQTGKGRECVYVVGESAFHPARLELRHRAGRASRNTARHQHEDRHGRAALGVPDQTPGADHHADRDDRNPWHGVYLESDPAQTYFCTCYGLAEVSATNDKESTETVAAKHHDKPLYILAKEKPDRTSAARLSRITRIRN